MPVHQCGFLSAEDLRPRIDRRGAVIEYARVPSIGRAKKGGDTVFAELSQKALDHNIQIAEKYTVFRLRDMRLGRYGIGVNFLSRRLMRDGRRDVKTVVAGFAKVKSAPIVIGNLGDQAVDVVTLCRVDRKKGHIAAARMHPRPPPPA